MKNVLLNMNKRGDVALVGLIFVASLLLGLTFFGEEKIIEKNRTVKYIGDNSTKNVYDLSSNNPDCKIANIKILQEDLEYFKSKEEALNQGFMFDSNCN